jgi:hypothetical protein
MSTWRQYYNEVASSSGGCSPFCNHRFSKILLLWTREKRCHGVHKLFTNTTEIISDRVSSLAKRTLTMCGRATTFVCF